MPLESASSASNPRPLLARILAHDRALTLAAIVAATALAWAYLARMAAGMAEVWRSRRLPAADPAPFACPVCRSDECEHVPQEGRWRRFWRFVLFGMGDDLGPTLALGIVLGGALVAFVPPGCFEAYLGNHWVVMLVMLLVGLPLYVCASASTPMAAALVLKGLNPGAALVFLLAGPATNLATVLMVSRMLGKASAVIYVGTIAVMSLVCGAILDLAAGALNVNAAAAAGAELPRGVQVAGAIVLGLYLLWTRGRWTARKLARPRAAEICGPAVDPVPDPCSAGDRACDAGGHEPHEPHPPHPE
jgi:hypothetical protein